MDNTFKRLDDGTGNSHHPKEKECVRNGQLWRASADIISEKCAEIFGT